MTRVAFRDQRRCACKIGVEIDTRRSLPPPSPRPGTNSFSSAWSGGPPRMGLIGSPGPRESNKRTGTISPGPFPGSNGRRPNLEKKKGIVTLSIAPRDVEPEVLYREISQRTGISWDTDPDAGPLLYVPAERIDEIVGKDLAKRILEDPADMGSFEGESLKIGGEGMKGFYDKIIPDFLNKFGKKWGAKVEESEIETGIMPGDAENNLPLVESEDPLQLLPDTVLRSVSSFPITQSMKESALTEGFPLFMPERSSWSDKTARVIPHSTIEKLKSHPDYGAAKAGTGRQACGSPRT